MPVKTADISIVEKEKSLIDNKKIAQWLEGALLGKKHSLAKLVSVFENQHQHATKQRQAILQRLVNDSRAKSSSFVLGVTGTPGAGKSTLIYNLCSRLLEQDRKLTIAVVAIDPSSDLSGGALLGDRVRFTKSVYAERLFFRSQASNLELGGITFNCFNVCRLLRYFFDLIIVETVGIGQNEIDVHLLADHSLLVLQPLSGDQIQFIKAGIMEIPDGFIVNKCDEELLAKQSYHLLRSSLTNTTIARTGKKVDRKPIFMTSELRPGSIEKLSEYVVGLLESTDKKSLSDIDTAFFHRWVKQAYGEFGLTQLSHIDPSLLAEAENFETLQEFFLQHITKKIN